MRKTILAGVILCLSCSTLEATSLILNEYNAVNNDDFLGDLGSGKVDSTLGRIMGNGGNWIELVVVQDMLDVRGWQLRWAETGADNTNGTDIWYGDSGVEQGIITFSNDPFWSNLRAGTILTVSEKGLFDTEDELGNTIQVDLSTDTSFDPLNDDWWIHISTRDEQAGAQPLLTTVTNVDGDSEGDFSVGPDDWELSIYTNGDVLDFGPAGEDISGWGGGGINGREAARLEADPSTLVTLDDYDDTTSTYFGVPNEWGSDPLHVQDFSALRSWVPEPASLSLLALAGLGMLKRRRTR